MLTGQLYELYRKHPVVCTDTRKLSSGCIFFALKGENFNGNRFALEALEAGAAYAVIDEPVSENKPDGRLIRVPDALLSLQHLAAYHRRQFDIPVIAIGGSNGKTTTKELVSAVLSSHYPCHYTSGNLNNHIGVPLTLLAMPLETEVAVIEMGTNQPGDIDQLCSIAMPTHGLLTNIGKEHLEGFGSLEGVKKAEGELYQYLQKQDGCAFVNTDEKYLKQMSRSIRKRIFYAESDTLKAQESMVDIQLLVQTPFLQLAFLSEDHRNVKVQTKLIGQHNFQNLMTAIALGIYFKVPAEKIKTALESYQPSNNRSQLIREGNNLIFLDAYNANPASMRAALETLQAMPRNPKIAILGDMLELGEESSREHERVLRLAARCKPDLLVLVGSEFGRCKAPKSVPSLKFPHVQEAKIWFEKQIWKEAFILIKASRGIQLEKILTHS